MMMNREDMKAMMSRMMGTQLPPDIDPQDLPDPQSEGARLLARYCTQCHNLPGPGMHTADEWPGVVDRMNQRMQMMSDHGMMGMMMGRIEAPSESELRELVAYLQAHAQRALDTTRHPELATPAGKVFRTACSRCHALPDPQQHTAKEWPRVVARMRQHMVTMRKPVPDEKAVGEIIGFLQRHARKPP